jgi:MoaA/NifB/PqqE/SkfB family radical SAM enzyme
MSSSGPATKEPSTETAQADPFLRKGAEEFPLMVVLSIIYPCNFGCPNCPYTDGNSEIRKFYHDRGGDLMPEALWRKIAIEAGPHQSWLRCTGGGEPMMHPRMNEMVEFAKEQGARVWMNSNGSMFGPSAVGRKKLERLIASGIDLIEFSMDAGDAEAYQLVRPPRRGEVADPVQRWKDQVDNVRAALEIRSRLGRPTRIIVSMIRQQLIESKLEQFQKFWAELGVDEVITRKFLSWDQNTSISLDKSLDRHLYKDLPSEKKEPCVWPFERLNVDTLGRIALCGQDIAFSTAPLFPNANDVSLKEIWQGEVFTWYRSLHLEGRGAEASPCRDCSAWLAGVRDWQHGWLKVLKNSERHVREVLKRDTGAEVDVYTPPAARDIKTQ